MGGTSSEGEPVGGDAARVAGSYALERAPEQLDLLRRLAATPAPTFHEERRAALVLEWLRDHGARDAHVDEAGNVICRIGPRDGRATVFSAHTDIVFDDTKTIRVREDDGRMFAPGVGDDTANLVNVLMGASWLLAHEDELTRPALIVANSCEEGLGNLRGTRALYERLGDRIENHVAFDLYLGQLISRAVGSHRYEIAVRTQGGHSFSDFGRPNAIAELCSVIGDLYAIRLATDEPVTFNVGRIEGGTTVNSIAAGARALYEYRSTSESALRAMSGEFRSVIDAHAGDGVEVSARTIGVRPGNAGVDEAALGALRSLAREAIRRACGSRDTEIDPRPASTDANIPLSMGVPAICVGSVRGGLLHTRDEWIDLSSMGQGLQLALHLMIALCRDGLAR